MNFLIYLSMMLLFSSCATTAVYDPLRSASRQILLLNESALMGVRVGMTIDEVHNVMGQEIIVGYMSQTFKNNESHLAPNKTTQVLPDAYKPLTIPNPYKSEEITTSKGKYIVEYYVSKVQQPDGVISNDELVPLVFSSGSLVGRGWPFLLALGPQE